MIFMKRLCSLVNFKVSYGTRRLMVCMDYDYHERYNFYNWNEDYYERHGNYDEGLRFNPKIDIPEFDGRIDTDEFLDWLNMVYHVFEYYDPPEHKKGEVGSYQYA